MKYNQAAIERKDVNMYRWLAIVSNSKGDSESHAFMTAQEAGKWCDDKLLEFMS